MRITGFEFRTVGIPFIERIEKYRGWDYPTTLIWVHTDEGITGIGESNSLDSNVSDRAEELEQKYVGKDIHHLDVAEEPFYIQCALYDILGQAHGVPIHKLIGPKARDQVELAYWSPPMPPEEMARESERARELGFRVHKVKGHRPDDIFDICRLIDSAVGHEIAIRMDPNTFWGNYSNAVRIASRLEPYNVEVYEDPFPFDDPSQYRQFRGKVTKPVARHLGSERQIFLFLKNEAMDCFNGGGNVGAMKRFDAIARGAGVPMWGQMFAFGSCAASMFAVHIAATLPACSMALDELPHTRVDDLSGGSFEMNDGKVTVPDTPGLGVSLDMSAVERYGKPDGYVGTRT